MIYVDQVRDTGVYIGTCHMITDGSVLELAAMAERVGCDISTAGLIVSDCGPCFLITREERIEAIAAGAEVVTEWSQFVKIGTSASNLGISIVSFLSVAEEELLRLLLRNAVNNPFTFFPDKTPYELIDSLKDKLIGDE